VSFLRSCARVLPAPGLPARAALARAALALIALVALTLLSGHPALATAQDAQDAQPLPDRLQGILLVGGVPADTGTVILHRVTPEDAGPVDSVRVQPDGSFSFLLPELPGASGAMYFATHRHEGVVYFAPPVTTPERLLELYELRAWVTRPLTPDDQATFRVAFRNIFIEEGPDGWRVTDVFEVGHEDAVTWRSPGPEGEVPVWRHPLPEGARNLQAAETEVDPGSLRLDRGALEVMAPFPPGDRLFVVRYDLPSLEAVFPMPGVTLAVELLVREPAPAMRVEGLRADAPVEIERGSVYRRWWAEEVRDIAPRTRLGEARTSNAAWIGVGVALFLVVAGSFLVSRMRGTLPVAGGGSRAQGPVAGGGGAPGGSPRGTGGADGTGAPPRTRQRILVELAHLEEGMEAGTLAPDEARVRRARLMEELAALDPGDREAT
jgi:hypothetical protein